MFKAQMKFQKIVPLVLLIVAAVVFVYSLGFFTDFHKLAYFLQEESDVHSMPNEYGLPVFGSLHDFNDMLVAISIIMICATLTLYITFTNKRRLYHIANYVAIGIASATYAVCAVIILINCVTLTQTYLQMDFEFIVLWLNELLQQNFNTSTRWLDAGIYIAILILISVAMLVLNLIWKLSLMKKEKAMLDAVTTATEATL